MLPLKFIVAATKTWCSKNIINHKFKCRIFKPGIWQNPSMHTFQCKNQKAISILQIWIKKCYKNNILKRYTEINFGSSNSSWPLKRAYQRALMVRCQATIVSITTQKCRTTNNWSTLCLLRTCNRLSANFHHTAPLTTTYQTSSSAVTKRPCICFVSVSS